MGPKHFARFRRPAGFWCRRTPCRTIGYRFRVGLANGDYLDGTPTNSEGWFNHPLGYYGVDIVPEIGVYDITLMQVSSLSSNCLAV